MLVWIVFIVIDLGRVWCSNWFVCVMMLLMFFCLFFSVVLWLKVSSWDISDVLCLIVFDIFVIYGEVLSLGCLSWIRLIFFFKIVKVLLKLWIILDISCLSVFIFWVCVRDVFICCLWVRFRLKLLSRVLFVVGFIIGNLVLMMYKFLLEWVLILLF